MKQKSFLSFFLIKSFLISSFLELKNSTARCWKSTPHDVGNQHGRCWKTARLVKKLSETICFLAHIRYNNNKQDNKNTLNFKRRNNIMKKQYDRRSQEIVRFCLDPELKKQLKIIAVQKETSIQMVFEEYAKWYIEENKGGI